MDDLIRFYTELDDLIRFCTELDDLIRFYTELDVWYVFAGLTSPNTPQKWPGQHLFVGIKNALFCGQTKCQNDALESHTKELEKRRDIFGLDIFGLDIFGVDILSVDILGVDIYIGCVCVCVGGYYVHICLDLLICSVRVKMLNIAFM